MADHHRDPVRVITQAMPTTLQRLLAERGGLPGPVRDTILEQLRARTPGQLAERVHRRWYAHHAHLTLDQLKRECDQIALALVQAPPCTRVDCEDGFLLPSVEPCPHCLPARAMEPDTVEWRPSPEIARRGAAQARAAAGYRPRVRPARRTPQTPVTPYIPAPPTLREPEDAWPPPGPGAADSPVLRAREKTRDPRHEAALRRAREQRGDAPQEGRQ